MRIGILGASSIAPTAIVAPVRGRDDVEIVAVAARHGDAARDFAERHGIARGHEGYRGLVDADDVDLVYIGLPASLHAEWAIQALEAGKHVLVEKPAATCTVDARRMARVAGMSGRRLVEAFHYRYHPLFSEVLSVVRSGELGRLLAIESTIGDPRPFRSGSVLHDPSLGGGALLHAGCYPVHWMRALTGLEPVVVSASSRRNPAGADESIAAELRFGETSGTMRVSFAPDARAGNRVSIVGERGRIDIENPIVPQHGGEARVHVDGGMRRLDPGIGTSYGHQLAAVVEAVSTGAALPTETDDIVGNAVALEAIGRAASDDLASGT